MAWRISFLGLTIVLPTLVETKALVNGRYNVHQMIINCSSKAPMAWRISFLGLTIGLPTLVETKVRSLEVIIDRFESCSVAIMCESWSAD